MNTIASLIAIDQDKAECAVEDLSALFRSSLAEMSTEVPVDDELDLCRRYLRMEQLRLGDRLRVRWEIDEIDPAVMVPSVSIQPLVENAVYHGIQALPEGGEVVIEAMDDDEWVVLRVTNPIPDEAAAKHKGNHIAQENIRNRLQALYGPKANLTSKLEDGFYQAEIRYPQES